MPLDWRETASCFIPHNWTTQDKGERDTFAKGVLLSECEADPSRPLLGYYAAGDLKRYATMYQYVVSLCSPSEEPWVVEGPDLPEFGHDEYIQSLQDSCVDVVTASAAPTAYVGLRVIPEATTDNEEPLDLLLEMDASPDMHGPSNTDVGVSALVEQQPVVSGSSSGVVRTRKPHVSELSRDERKNGAADRNKFIDLDAPCMPQMLAGWKEAGLRLSSEYHRRLAVEDSYGYAFPLPEHLATTDTAFLKTHMLLHELLTLRLDLRFGVLTAKEWRMVLGRGVLKRPNANNKRGLKRWEAAEELLERAVSELPNIVSALTVPDTRQGLNSWIGVC